MPKNLEIDLYEGESYISIVAFTMEKIRPRFLPSLSFISNFHEINVRTYVKKNGKSGVYFLSIESEKFLSTFVAKTLSGLPYKTVCMKRTDNSFVSVNKIEDFELNLKFNIGNEITSKSDFEKWSTERYALFLEEDSKLYKYEIHHKEWKLNKINFEKLEYKYKLQSIDLNRIQPVSTHYSKGIEVIAWKRELA